MADNQVPTAADGQAEAEPEGQADTPLGTAGSRYVTLVITSVTYRLLIIL
jgi:hypothetical protein